MKPRPELPRFQTRRRTSSSMASRSPAVTVFWMSLGFQNALRPPRMSDGLVERLQEVHLAPLESFVGKGRSSVSPSESASIREPETSTTAPGSKFSPFRVLLIPSMSGSQKSLR